jgi:Rv0078B-related antitoxin
MLIFFRQKTNQERIQIGFQMMEDGRNMIATTLRQQHPDWSEIDLKIGIFNRMYQRDFSEEELVKITDWFRRKPNNSLPTPAPQPATPPLLQ